MRLFQEFSYRRRIQYRFITDERLESVDVLLLRIDLRLDDVSLERKEI